MKLDKIKGSAEYRKFINLKAQGVPNTKAYRQAFPHAKDYKHATVYNKTSELMKDRETVTEIETTKHKKAVLARLAETKIEQALTSDKLNKTSTDVAMFIYDHANGKAIQRQQIQSQVVTLQMDLSGGDGGDVPQEVIDQLADE